MFLPTKYVTHIFQLRLFQTSVFKEPWKIIQKALSHGFLDQSRPCTYTGRVVTFLSSNSAAWRWCKRIARKVDKRIMLKCTTVCKRVRKLIIHFVFKWTSTIYSRLNFKQTCWKNKRMGSCFRTYHHQQGPLFSSMACFGVFYSQIVFHELSPSKRVWVRLWTLGLPSLCQLEIGIKRCTLSWWFTDIRYNYTTIIYWYWIHPPHFYVLHSKKKHSQACSLQMSHERLKACSHPMNIQLPPPQKRNA